MELTVDQALQRGIEAHRAGKTREADEYYTAILQANPKHPDANHNMGVLSVGVGKIDTALPFFKVALEANSSIAQFWLSYIDALIKLKQIDEARELFEQAKSKGTKGDGFEQVEQRLYELEKSTELYAAASNLKEPPKDQLQSIVNLYTQDLYQKALTEAEKLLVNFPNSTNLYNIIGAANQNLGNLKDAVDAYKKAISIKPDYAEAYYNMGNSLQLQGKLNDTIDAYKKAISIKADYSDAYNNMGAAYKDQGKLDGAIHAFKQAISIKPDYADAHNNIGVVFQDQGKLEEAIKAFRQAISVKPDFAGAYYNMGIALRDLSKLDEAIEAYNKALSIEPDYADTYWNLVGTAEDINEAKKWVGKCLDADPKHLLAKLTLSALQFYEGDKSAFMALLNSPLKDHPYIRSATWAFELPDLPPLHFHRWALFDHMISLSKKDRPFYEFGVWRGEAFKHLIKTFKRGYGFDTFEGLPENWHNEKAGIYSSEGDVPKIKGGNFIVGKFEDTLPDFFAEDRPMASIINFDADLYSSTICALNFAKPVIDKHTILIFDEFIINRNWEQDEYKALEEFCSNTELTYEVLAISFFTKQVAVKIVGI